MQREIKFRAWDKINKRMVNVDGVSSFEKDDSSELKYITCSQGVIDWKDIILMQFTGLLDKNGKEIFEGDLLKIRNFNGIGTVVFENGAYRVGGFYLGDIYLESEVIGNIFENPELLEANAKI